jgi:hypothetical protein
MLSYNECIVRHSGQAKLAPLLTSGNCICESIDTVVQTSRFFFQGARIFRDGTINMINKNHKNMLHVSCLCRLCSSSNISGPIGSWIVASNSSKTSTSCPAKWSTGPDLPDLSFANFYYLRDSSCYSVDRFDRDSVISVWIALSAPNEILVVSASDEGFGQRAHRFGELLWGVYTSWNNKDLVRSGC